MSALLHLMMGAARRRTITRTFTSNESFTMPAGISVLLSVSGAGAPGTPEGGVRYVDKTTITTSYIRRDGGPPYQVIDTVDGWSNGGAAYCDNAIQYSINESTVYYGQITCYNPSRETITNPATTGASASGFGKTFPGGAGGPATVTSFSNVAVTPQTVYSVVVPAGGSITITYQP